MRTQSLDDVGGFYLALHHLETPLDLCSSAKKGGIAFALFPLAIAFALKAPSFALLAILGLVGYAHDKTTRLHRYAIRLAWLVTTLDVVL